MFGIGQARRPGSLSPSEVAQGFGLIPVGGNGVEGTFNKDMTNDGMIFEAHKRIVKNLNREALDPNV